MLINSYNKDQFNMDNFRIDSGLSITENTNADVSETLNMDWVGISSTAFSALSSISQGLKEAEKLNLQADLTQANNIMLAQNDFTIRQSYDRAINEEQEQGAIHKGEQLSTMSSSGFSVKSESYQNILENTDYNIAKNLEALNMERKSQLIQNEYNMKMNDIQASLYRSQAKAAKKGGYANALLGVGKSFLGV